MNFTGKTVKISLSLANNSSKAEEFLKLRNSLFSILSILKSYLHSKILYMWIREYVKWLRLNLSRPNPGRREKIKLNLYFHTSLRCLKRFYEGLNQALKKTIKRLLFHITNFVIDIVIV